jgi:catechol 2,3-dioxygenase-like lactoylglutathione lyase family enzyme
MKFQPNNYVAIHMKDLKKTEKFYTALMGFTPLRKSGKQLEYQTRHFLLFINKGSKTQSPIPSSDVKSVIEAKGLLKKDGCTILVDRGNSLYFRDPFGIVYDIIKG